MSTRIQRERCILICCRASGAAALSSPPCKAPMVSPYSGPFFARALVPPQTGVPLPRIVPRHTQPPPSAILPSITASTLRAAGSVPDRPVTASDLPPSQNLPRSMQSQSVPCRGADGQRAGHQHHRDRYAQDFGLKSQDRAGRVVQKSEFSVGRECLAPAGSSASHNDDPAGFNRVRAEEQEQRHDQRRSNEFSH